MGQGSPLSVEGGAMRDRERCGGWREGVYGGSGKIAMSGRAVSGRWGAQWG